MASTNDDERDEELSTLVAIYPELIRDPKAPYNAYLDLPVAPSAPLNVVFQEAVKDALLTPPVSDDEGDRTKGVVESKLLSYLPPLSLKIVLPEGYPAERAPTFELNTSPEWLPQDKLQQLQEEGHNLWEEYGRGQIVFAYIGFLQDAAERAFDLDLVEVAQTLKSPLLQFNFETEREIFEQGTYDCGVCLEPKKGKDCFKLSCGHVFCRACLQDFYNSAISEGDVSTVRCLSPNCEKTTNPSQTNRRKPNGTLKPSELLQIPLEKETVQRYVELKRKKKIESDKSTVYCPRQWCQGFAKSKKYPKITDLDQIVNYDLSDSEESEPETYPDEAAKNKSQSDRLSVCEKCDFAFCRTCLKGWHGELVRCWPRSTEELSEEDKASYEYLRLHSSPCPSCNAPVQKSMGCNHMTCFQCRTHFCYLCGAWLDPGNPYRHFNGESADCYNRLWVLEEGDNGDEEQRVQFGGARGAEQAIEVGEQNDAQAQVNDEAIQAALLDDMEPIELANMHFVLNHEGRPAGNAPQPNGPREVAPAVVAPVVPAAGVQRAQPAQQGNRGGARNGAPQPGRGRGARRAGLNNQGPLRRDQRRDPGAAHAAHGGVGHGEVLDPGRQGMANFIRMAMEDAEDGWDSDELDEAENDGMWDIPER